MKTFLKISLILAMCGALHIPALSMAASISFELPAQEIPIGRDFMVDVFLDTEGESINAVDGSITFPSNILKVQEVREGNSQITFWMEKPHAIISETTSMGTINFSGIATAGMSGSRQFLFSVVLHSETIGEGVLDAPQIRILKNDGNGTEVPATVFPFRFAISNEVNIFTPDVPTLSDNDPPEDFLPYIANDIDVYGGKYFVVFAAQDKGSGIDHYEVREGDWGQFMVATSPYLLTSQSLNKDITIKAIDKSGNERMMTIEAQNKTSPYQLIIILSILVVLIAVALIAIKLWHKWQKFIHS